LVNYGALILGAYLVGKVKRAWGQGAETMIIMIAAGSKEGAVSRICCLGTTYS
jgi:hypothetical protein